MEPLRQTSAVLLVLALLAGLLWLLRRRAAPAGGCRTLRGGTKPLARAGRLPLSPHHAVELVRVGSRVLVVALYSSGCSLLANLPAEELETAAGGRETRRAGDPPATGGLGERRALS